MPWMAALSRSCGWVEGRSKRSSARANWWPAVDSDSGQKKFNPSPLLVNYHYYWLLQSPEERVTIIIPASSLSSLNWERQSSQNNSAGWLVNCSPLLISHHISPLPKYSIRPWGGKSPINGHNPRLKEVCAISSPPSPTFSAWTRCVWTLCLRRSASELTANASNNRINTIVLLITYFDSRDVLGNYFVYLNYLRIKD